LWNSNWPEKLLATRVPLKSPLDAVTVASGASTLAVKAELPNWRVFAW